MTRPSEAARFLTGEALAALGRLRAAWPWLAEARVPGPEGPTMMPPDQRDHVARIRAEQAAKDRRAKGEALSGVTRPGVGVNPSLRGRPSVPPGPHADAGRTGPVAARAEVAGMVRLLLERMWLARYGEQATFGVADPASRPARIMCPDCDGRGIQPQPEWWVGPEDGGREWRFPVCPMCGTSGEVTNPAQCVACEQVGRCDCDLADAVVVSSLRLIAVLLGAVPAISDPNVAGDAARTLDRADRLARRAARAGEHRIHIKAACPACQGRDLWAETSSPNRDEWTVRCESAMCSCNGPGCPCGRPVRWRGRRHMWPAAEWGRVGGLADRLGVPLPDLGGQMGRLAS